MINKSNCYEILDISNCTQFESNVTDTLSIDLYDHFQNRSYVNIATFIVVNTSRECDRVKAEQHHNDN